MMIQDNWDGLTLFFAGEDEKILLAVNFETTVAYRNLDEGDRWRTLGKVEKEAKLLLVNQRRSH